MLAVAVVIIVRFVVAVAVFLFFVREVLRTILCKKDMAAFVPVVH